MNCHFALIEHDAPLHLVGPDAATFLQGQVTCDTRALAPGQALPGLYCTVQGRVIADFLLYQLAPEHLALRMRRDIRPTCAAALAKYSVFSKATIEAQRDDWQVFACWGAGASAALAELFGAAPQERYAVCQGAGFALVQLDDQGEQFECVLDTGTHPDLANTLARKLPAAPASSWQALQLRQGIGRIEATTTGEFIPQMLNYDITGHISFKKGCYTGQEVVARMHYRGKPKRRMYLATLAAAGAEAATTARAGTPVYTAGTSQAIGAVVNSVRTAAGELLALVTATAGGVSAGLHLGDPAGPRLQLGQLPYSLPPA